MFNPAVKLVHFVQEMGASLHTITSLELHVHVVFHEGQSTSELDAALAMLFRSCPALTSLNSEEQLSVPIMTSLGQACMSLSSLNIPCPEESNTARIQKAMVLLPTLLPQLTSLTFQQRHPQHPDHSQHSTIDYKLPDVSNHTGVRTMDLQGHVLRAESWARLPHQLQHLRSEYLSEGPSVCADEAGLAVCASLLSIKTHFVDMPLPALAQLLRAAPSLQTLKAAHRKNASPTIKCSLLPSTPSDFSILLQHTQMDLVGNAVFLFDFSNSVLNAPALRQLIAALPLMTGASKCEIISLQAAALVSLLRRFPDIRELTLTLKGLDDVGNDELQAVAVCPHLVSLKLKCSSRVSITGLISLCQRLPRLVKIACQRCPRLTAPTLEYGAKFLERQTGLVVEMVDVTEPLQAPPHHKKQHGGGRSK